ncbi:MAG TPA: DUF4437 domain-containing protein [Acidimicrobiales bacterium]|nr:DUF4437 domain-containing protein [Acidimicrobiales bacterium]
MSRPFIEFVQCQTLPWTSGLYGGARPEVEVRVLSVDDETGASSLLVRYPPGFERREPHRLACDEEFFVLDGSLEVGDLHYGRYCYAHLPAGFERTAMRAPEGALAVTFFSGEPRLSSEPMRPDDAARLVERVDALEGEWTGNFHPQFPPGAGRKWLKQDPVRGDQTWVLGTMPLRSGRRAERHPVVEELFLVAGSLVGPLGTMYPGCYFWRPPGEWHGPFGTLTGNVELFRTVGGPLTTEYAEAESEFSWHPPYAPIVPTSLADAPDRYRASLARFEALEPAIFAAG